MKLDAVGLIAKDVLKTIRFYSLLGLSFEKDGSGEHYEGIASNGMRLILDSEELIKSINPSWSSQQGSRIVLCFKQNNSKDVDNAYGAIIDAGFTSVKEPWDAFWGQRYSSVLDPDGNQIDIFSDL